MQIKARASGRDKVNLSFCKLAMEALQFEFSNTGDEFPAAPHLHRNASSPDPATTKILAWIRHGKIRASASWLRDIAEYRVASYFQVVANVHDANALVLNQRACRSAVCDTIYAAVEKL